MKKLIEKARAKAAAAVDRQKALAALIEAENRDFTEAEQAEFDAKSLEVEQAAKDIEKFTKAASQAESVERAGVDAQRAANDAAVSPVIKAVSSITDVKKTSEPQRVEMVAKTAEQRYDDACREVGIFAQAVALEKMGAHKGRTALEIVADLGFEGLATKSVEVRDEYRANLARQTGLSVERVFSLSTANTATNLTFTPLSPDYIEMLRNQSIFLAGGPRRIDMPLGALKIPGGNTPASGSYTSLGTDIPYGEMTTRQVSMTAKHLRTLTSIDNYSAETSPLAVASIVGDDLAQVLTLTMDSAGLRGDGTGNNPSGVYTLMGAGQRITATNSVAPTYTEVDTDAGKILTKYWTSNVPRRKPTWLMSNRVFLYLKLLKNSLGVYIYEGLQNANPTWHGGYPVLTSEQIPSNLGAGTNESELYLVDFGHVLIGDTKALMLEASREASYVNASAQMVSAFSRNETVIRGIAAHDFAMRHVKAAVCATAVKWGA